MSLDYYGSTLLLTTVKKVHCRVKQNAFLPNLKSYNNA